MKCTTLTWSAILALTFVSSADLAASPALRGKLKPLAQDIFNILDEEKQQAVAFADFPPGSVCPVQHRPEHPAHPVGFAAAWSGDNRPADEGGSRNPGGFETGFGPPRRFRVPPTQGV